MGHRVGVQIVQDITQRLRASPVFEPNAAGMCLALDPHMSKHKSPSQSPDLRRIERAGGPLPSAATTELAELDTDPAIKSPAEDSSAQHEGMHRPPAPSGKQ